MKRPTSSKAAPRRLLLQERAPAAPNASTTHNNISSKASTAITPSSQPVPSKHHESAPSDPSPDSASSSGGGGSMDSNVRFDSSSVAVTALVILSALFFLGFFSVYARRFFAPDWDNPDASASSRSRRRRGLALAGRVPIGAVGAAYPHAAPRGLDPEAIKALPAVRYSEELAGQRRDHAAKSKDINGARDGGVAEGEEDHRCCAVCLGEFTDGEELRMIPGCGHAFHRECIDAWLSARGSCPLCRTTDLFGAGKLAGQAAAQRGRLDVCQLESVVVVPPAAAAESVAAAGRVEGGGGGVGGQLRRVEGDKSQTTAEAAAAAPTCSHDAQGLGGMGRSRSWLCMSGAATEEDADNEKGPPPPAAAAAVARDEQPPRRSCN